MRFEGDAPIPVILAGGSGTRLWPLSRKQHPKQFLPLLTQHSLFQETVLRVRELPHVPAPVVVVNEAHRFLVRDQLAELGVEGSRILLEPIGRNTAPALALAARQVVADDPDALLLALPADHRIEDSAQFVQAVDRGMRAAARGAMVVFGVVPVVANTGYGYIHKGAGNGTEGVWMVAGFIEKPDAEKAADYVCRGDYLWNSGMFLVRADVYLSELETHAPDIAATVAKAAAALKYDDGFLWPDRELFSSCRGESIDYAVMEHTRAGMLVELDAGWSDLGSWASLMEAGRNGTRGNVTRGDVLLADVSGSLIHSSGRLVAAVGLRDQVVVETPDAVLVAPVARAQEVKQLVEMLRDQGREEAEIPLRVHRPWGWYEILARGERIQVKRFEVKPGAGFALQLQHRRDDHWVVVRGAAEVTCGEKVFTLRENQSMHIPPENRHRLRNNGDQPLQIIAVQSGEYLSGDDVVHVDDEYNIPPL